MRAFLRLYAALMRIAILTNVQYRASGVIWMIGMILEPVIYLIVWSTVAESGGEGTPGFDARDLAAYYLTFFLCTHVTFSWVMEVFQYRVQQGMLSFELLRPLHPIHEDLAENVGYKLVMLVVLLPAAVALYFAFDPRFTPVAWSLACFALALPLGFCVRFLIEWSLALSAFWTTRTTAVNRAYYSVLLFLSGRAAPIALLPAWLAAVAHALPFYWMVGFPVELALGRLTPEEAARGIATQLAWIVVAVAGLSLLWRAAVRRYAAVGQ
jgi:ABC-2 type transport system permease protein